MKAKNKTFGDEENFNDSFNKEREENFELLYKKQETSPVVHSPGGDLIYFTLPENLLSPLPAIFLTIRSDPSRAYRLPENVRTTFSISNIKLLTGEEVNSLYLIEEDSSSPGKILNKILLDSNRINSFKKEFDLNKPNSFIVNSNPYQAITVCLEIGEVFHNSYLNITEDHFVTHSDNSDLLYLLMPANLSSPKFMISITIKPGNTIYKIPERIINSAFLERVFILNQDSINPLYLEIVDSKQDSISQIVLNNTNTQASNLDIDFNSPNFQIRNPNPWQTVTILFEVKNKN